MGNNFDVIISTCDKFSDLWDANVLLLNENWKERGKQTYLVTDVPTDRTFQSVEVISAGIGTEITTRLFCALEKVEEPYVLFTLDDYFLTEPIDNNAILRAVAVMEAENLDYMRLYPATKRYLKKEGAVQLADQEGYFLRNIAEGNYKISLYPGLWRTDFMRKTLSETLNAWQYEVALTDMARRFNARCAISNHKEFPFLDVIRKGKVLRKAQRYFKKNPIYRSQRLTMTAWAEWKLNFRTFLRHVLPASVFKWLKNMMIKGGAEFYSSEK